MTVRYRLKLGQEALIFGIRNKGLQNLRLPSVGLPFGRAAIVPRKLVTGMPLNSQDIDRIAQLARLKLTPEASERMLGQINGFFDIVEQMRAVDTTGIEPLAHPVAAIGDIALRLRDDVASEPNQREANQRSAPAVERGLFLVPKVIE